MDGRFVHANPKLCGILQRSATHIETLTLQDITHADDLDIDLQLLEECLDGSRASYHLTKRYMLPDHTHVTTELTVAIIRSSTGIPLHFISQIRPIPDHQAKRTQAHRQTHTRTWRPLQARQERRARERPRHP